MIRNITFITRYHKVGLPTVTVYIDEKTFKVFNLIERHNIPADMDLASFLEAARGVINQQFQMLTEEEVDLIRDFIIIQ